MNYADDRTTQTWKSPPEFSYCRKLPLILELKEQKGELQGPG